MCHVNDVIGLSVLRARARAYSHLIETLSRFSLPAAGRAYYLVLCTLSCNVDVCFSALVFSRFVPHLSLSLSLPQLRQSMAAFIRFQKLASVAIESRKSRLVRRTRFGSIEEEFFLRFKEQ